MSQRIERSSITRWFATLILYALISIALSILLTKTTEGHNTFNELLRTVAAPFKSTLDTIPIPFFGRFNISEIMLGSFIAAYLSCLVIHFILIKLVQRGRSDYLYSSGIKLLKGKRVKKNASSALKKSRQKAELLLHPDVPLSDKVLTGNVFVTGMQGSGKSTIIKSLLLQLAATKHRLFIFDLKHEYDEFVDKKNTTTLNVEKMSKKLVWDICHDVTELSDAASISEALVEDVGGDNQFFTDAAREIIKGVLLSLMKSTAKWGWGDFSSRLFASRDQLHTMLSYAYPPAAMLVEDDNKTTQSIRAVISTKVGWISSMADSLEKGDRTFSIKQWIEGEPSQSRQIIFQPFVKEFSKSKALCNAITALISANILEMADQEEIKTFLILDELGNLSKLNFLESFLSLSRSKGGRTIAGTQSLSQLSTVYGDASSTTLLSLFKTHVVLGLGAAGSSAKQASEAMGNHRVVSIQRTKSDSGSISLSEQFADRAILSPEDIVNIPEPDEEGVTGYASIGGRDAIYTLKWTYPTPICCVSRECS